MTTTFKELRERLRKEIWPAGEARSMRDAHNSYFQRAMLKIQTPVPCLQQNNVNVYKFCSTYNECGVAIVQAPVGFIKRAYTIANDDWCDKVIYSRATIDRLRCWSQNLGKVTIPLNVGRETLPTGFRFAESSTDSVCGRARIGKWALHNGRFYMSPWIQSNENIVIEWDGPRAKWADEDVLNQDIWRAQEENAIKLFVLWHHELFFGDPGRAAVLEQQFNNELGDIIWECTERQNIPDQAGCADQRSVTSEELTDDAVPDASQYVVGVVGDYGQDGIPEADVAAVIKGSAKIVLTAGNNTYSSDLANNILKHYTTFIDRTDATNTKFWPTWGPKDWDQSSLQTVLSYFKLLGNERYYAVVDGPVHYFLMDTDPREPDLEYVDASTSKTNSIMGKWLRAMAAISTADWKVAVGFHAPKSSDSVIGSNAWMDWDFAGMGIDLVISGSGAYEHIEANGINYIVNGIGGVNLRAFGAPVAGSQFRYNADYGGQILTATSTKLESNLYDRGGGLIHTVTMEK